ncbi:unnamed protein product [Bursaphelenchus xylophilus]|uniref:(pine wood nematode) hypothetical protein n=1 Tax=Bursaphelenchus xylophilus TaxID=6326 RepID=A0A1I7S1E0_BURXY|nr:unnamed protein product [Bursaphelenchus xylophilus]CAG9081650.1 unnamed protein product [Bursaphelenchus xylophilus]
MHKLVIYTTRGTVLDTRDCQPAATLKELIGNALGLVKIRLEDVCCLKRQGEDGKWLKISWKEEIPKRDCVYQVTRDPLKTRLKHRVRVVDYDGEEIGLIPTKSGIVVQKIVNEVVMSLGVEMKNVFIVEVLRENRLLGVKLTGRIKREERLVITLDLLERDAVEIDAGEPILPKCLTILKLDEMLSQYQHRLGRHGIKSVTNALDPKEVLSRLKAGEAMTDSEKLLISKCVAPPLQEHCFKRDSPWRREIRLYLANLFAPYPQLHIPDFVSEHDTKVEINVLEKVMIANLVKKKEARRARVMKLLKRNNKGLS